MPGRIYSIIGPDGNVYNDLSTEQVREWLAQGYVNEQTMACPAGQVDWTPLGQLPEILESVPDPKAITEISGKRKNRPGAEWEPSESTGEYLERVQQNSCYQTARWVIWLCFKLIQFLMCLSILAIVILGIVMLFSAGSPVAEVFIVGIFLILYMVVMLVISRALEQWVLAFLDIADVLIDANRR